MPAKTISLYDLPQYQQLYEQIETIVNCLIPSNDDLLRVCRTLQIELDQALRFPVPDSLHVYPTFVQRLPNGYESGRYLALDLGGTNFRILLINLNGYRESTVNNKIFAISQQLMHGSGIDLFNYIAQCVYDFCLEHNIVNEKLRLGFTFSFPCKQVGLKKAYLTSWTKGFCCSGTINQDVCEMLQRALSRYRRLKIEVSAIVNDTTGTLISCAYLDPRCKVGVIIGTGINLCYVESDREKFEASPMIINTELGALGSRNRCLDFIQTQWDKQVDVESINPGEQLFEKMISGMYMGEIVRTVSCNLINLNLLFNGINAGEFHKKNSFFSSYVSKVELDDEQSTFNNTHSVLNEMGIENPSDVDCRTIFKICSAVSKRSAFLVSAAIATILHRIGDSFIVVGVDGSVFRHHPHYQSMMYDKIEKLLQLLSPTNNEMGVEFKLMLSEDGSGRGAALVAALPDFDLQQQPNCGICQHCSQPDCFEADTRRCILIKQ